MKALLAAFVAVLFSGAAMAAGPRAPVGPQTLPACVGVALTPGNIQTAVNANPTGTKFCLGAGTWTGQHVVPKTGNTFEGVIGTILDGGTAVRAFDGSASNVTISNLIIQNYKAGYQNAPIYAVNATGWKVLNTEIKNNSGVGMLFKDNVLIQYNNIHHNLEMGVGSDGGVGIQFLDNEVAYNNHLDTFDCDECGGSKFWATTNALVGWNYFHDNHGPGIWFDYNNFNATIRNNRVLKNFGPGIHYEISYDALIRNNTVRDNGNSGWSKWNCDWFFCSQILLAASGGVNTGLVEVRNNTVRTPGPYADGIGLIQQNRASGQESMGPYEIKNILIHDNTIDLCKGGRVGGVQDLNSNKMFQAAANNHFEDNHYTLCGNLNAFEWANGGGDAGFWKGHGMDQDGTFE